MMVCESTSVLDIVTVSRGLLRYQRIRLARKNKRCITDLDGHPSL